MRSQIRLGAVLSALSSTYVIGRTSCLCVCTISLHFNHSRDGIASNRPIDAVVGYSPPHVPSMKLAQKGAESCSSVFRLNNDHEMVRPLDFLFQKRVLRERGYRVP